MERSKRARIKDVPKALLLTRGKNRNEKTTHREKKTISEKEQESTKESCPWPI